VDWDDFSTYFFAKNPLIKDDKRLLFEAGFTKLKMVNPTLKSSLLKTYLERYHAERISFMSMEVAEGRKRTLEEIQVELDNYMDVSGKAEEIGKEANRDDLTTLLTRVSHGIGLEWRLPCLNESLGPIRRGNFLIIGGRPDSGKTTLLCSEATHMATQLKDDEKVIYFSNEEGGDVVKTRIISSMLGVTFTDLEMNPLRYWSEYVKLLGGIKDKILIIEKPDLAVSDIEWWLNNEKPGLILIDQLRKVRGFEDYKGVNRLEKLFNLAREWSKMHAPVLTVTQLDGSAENEQWPDMSRLYESKTAVQGEADVIMNIGRIHGSVPDNARFLNIVKNKLPTPGNPTMRNGRHEVLIQADIGRFT